MRKAVHMGARAAPDGSDDRGVAARQQFYAAFWQELTERGYAGLTVAGVARRAGASRGCFYHHFRDLDDLCVKTYRAHTESTLQYLRQSIDDGRSVADTLVSDVSRLIRALPEPTLILAVLELHLLGFRNEGVRAAVLQDYERKTAEAAHLIRLGIQRGEFRRDCDPAWEAERFYCTCFGLYHVHFATGDPRDLASKVERHLFGLFHALRAPD